MYTARLSILLDKIGKDRYNTVHVGMWLSLVERIVRDDEAAGSNPVIPTIFIHIRAGAIGHRHFCF